MPKLANHLHLPVQTGSDRILAAMKRGYTALEYKQKIRRLRAVRPDISLSSDFIVGFPGETEADFRQTLDLIADVGFDQSFSFIYSPRPGTPAAALPDEMPHEVKQAAAASACRRSSTRQARRSAQSMVGSTQRVLVEKPVAPQPARARRPHREQPLGELRRAAGARRPVRDVRITEAMPNSLRGRLVA